LRHGDYEYVYAEQRKQGTMGIWAEPFTQLRLQKIYNLFQDPFERADITSNTYWDWNINQIGAVYGAMDEVGEFAESFKEFPPRSFPPSFVPTTIVSEIMDQIKPNARRPPRRANRGAVKAKPPLKYQRRFAFQLTVLRAERDADRECEILSGNDLHWSLPSLQRIENED
jgi:hypothetical protein